MCNSSKKLPGEIAWFEELSELCNNYDIATTEFCCKKGLLRQDTDGSDSFTCCGSYGCGTNYSSQDISKDCVKWEIKPCERCEEEKVILIGEDYCEECEEEMEEEDNEDEEEDEE